ncbi:MAG: hypothetical protein U9N59_08880 [Campylobacterota bacterium]|nr:hypothetical protein [Campylobacterota bacterium]
MTQEICKLLNISKRTYYNWNQKDEIINKTKYDIMNEERAWEYEKKFPGKTNKHYHIIRLVKSIFKNKEELEVYLKYDILPFSQKTYEGTNELSYLGELSHLLGVSKKGVSKFLKEKPKLNNLIIEIFGKNASEIKDFKIRFDYLPYEQLETKQLEKFISFLLKQDDYLMNAIIQGIAKIREHGFKHINTDNKLSLIKSIQISKLNRFEYVSVVNHINSFRITDEEIYELFFEYQNNFRQIIIYAFGINDMITVNKILKLFPNDYEIDIIKKFEDL